MALYLLRPLRACLAALLSHDSPQHWALGAALGMLAGLLPKDNLLALAVGVLLLALRLNLASAALATALFTLVGWWLDPWTHAFGKLVLTQPALQPALAGLLSWPLVPWTHLHNTVVLGNLLLGLALLAPTYLASRWLVVRGRAAWSAFKRREPVETLLAAAETSAGWRLS